MLDPVLITGASAGIGRAAALEFAQSGHSLFLVARRGQELEEVASSCRQAGASRVAVCAADLAEPGTGSRIVNDCLERLGDLGILICNAGYGIVGPLAETTPELMSRIWQVNFMAGYESIHRALPYFLAQGRGHILLTSSIVGKKAMPFMGAYCVTKFAQIALGEALWGELEGSGVRVSVICPGLTRTEFQQASTSTEGHRSEIVATSGQDPGEVARAMHWAVENGTREVHLTRAGRILLWLNRLAPEQATRLMARVGREARKRRRQK